jgi:hypothetical protein
MYIHTYRPHTQRHAPYNHPPPSPPPPFLHEARALGDQVPQALAPRWGGLIDRHSRSWLLAPRSCRRCHLHRGGRRRRLLSADILSRRRTSASLTMLLLLKLKLKQPLPRRVPRGPEVLLRRQELLVQLPARHTHMRQHSQRHGGQGQSTACRHILARARALHHPLTLLPDKKHIYIYKYTYTCMRIRTSMAPCGRSAGRRASWPHAGSPRNRRPPLHRHKIETGDRQSTTSVAHKGGLRAPLPFPSPHPRWMLQPKADLLLHFPHTQLRQIVKNKSNI